MLTVRHRSEDGGSIGILDPNDFDKIRVRAQAKIASLNAANTKLTHMLSARHEVHNQTYTPVTLRHDCVLPLAKRTAPLQL